MAKIGTNYNKEQFDLLFRQIANDGLSEDEIRQMAETAFENIDIKYLDAIEGILIGRDGKTEDFATYFRIDSDLIEEEDKSLGERNAINVIAFLNKLAKGEYELLSREKKDEKEKEEKDEVIAPAAEMAPPAPEEKDEIEEEADQKYFHSDEAFTEVFLRDRDGVETIGKRYDMPMFHSFGANTIAASELDDKEDLTRRFANTYEKIPAEYYEFLEKCVIGTGGVREDPRDYIEMTDDAYQKFFSFVDKAPGEALTPKEAKKVMNILANLAEGNIKLKEGLSERGLAYHKERLPQIFEKEAALRTEALKSARVNYNQDKAIGNAGVENFLADQKRAQLAAEKEYQAIKKGTPRFGATKEQKEERASAEQKMRREKAKYDLVKQNRKVYEGENKKIRKLMDPLQTAQLKLSNLKRKKELLGKDFSKKDEKQLKKAALDFAEKSNKLRKIQKEVLGDTAKRLKKEGNPFPEHTAMRLRQIATGQMQWMPLITQQETMVVYGVEKYKRQQEEAKRDFLLGRELSYASENKRLQAASEAYRDAYAQYKQLKQEQKKSPTPVGAKDKRALKALAATALEKGKELRALREKVIGETIARAKESGDPFPEHTAMRCEQIRAGQLGFTPLATKAETLQKTPGLSEKEKNAIVRASMVNAEKEQGTKPPSKPLPDTPTKKAEQETTIQKPDEVQKTTDTEIKRTPVVFPEGSIPSTTKAPEKPLVTPQKDISAEKTEQTKKMEEPQADL